MKNVDLVQYQNANQSFESIVEHFIVRKNEFERVMDDIRTTDASSSFQHYVFVGRRGSGKSTLLRRIQAEINLDDTLHAQYEVVNLGEEQSFIYRLYDLWDYVVRELSTSGYQFQVLDFRTYKDDMNSYTKDLHAQIIKALRSKNKRLVLLLDNIDRILDSRSGNLDAALFRELLINYHDIRIIGGSTFMSEHFWKYDKPFYQFFTIKKLEALSLKEVEELLIHWSEVKQIPEIKNIIKNHPGKIQSIRMLTDGMPRTMLLFVDMMINRPEQNGYQYLQQIVDKATPIYQERLGLLSDAQKKVLSELAFIWDAANVEELVPKCNMEGKVISALLNQLTDIRYVEKIKTKNKNNLYRLEERFFNLWFNMTQGGLNNRAKAKALTDFLEKWYEKTALNDLCLELTSLVTRGEANKDYIESMSHALLGSENIKSEYKQALKSQLGSKGLIKESEIGADLNKEEDKILEAFENKEYKKAITLLKNANIEDGRKYFGLGLAYMNLIELKEAEKYYLLSIEKGDIKALYNLALLYQNQGKAEEAEKYYLLAIEKRVKDALHNLALLYDDQGKAEEAEKYYLLAIEKGNIKALNNLAILYQNQGKAEEAEKYYLLAIEKGVKEALYNLAILYQNQGKAEEAEKYYLLAIEKGVKEALYNLAILYDNQGKAEEAEKYYLLAIEKGNITALYNLANLYEDQGNVEEAKKYYLLAIEKGHVDALNNLAALLYTHNRKSELIRLINGQPKALIDGFIDENLEFAVLTYLYIGDFDRFEFLSDKLLSDKKALSSLLLKSLLIHQQYHWVYKYFISHEEMIEKYNPLYYATLHLVDDKDQEILKMPPEIKETVESILDSIKKEQEFYGM
ncbi:MAG: tetratricopeptide repeat protein [Saprospiraceae bacterium]